jgi:sucrose phosphorylase
MQSKNQNDLKIKIKSHLDQIYKGQKNIVLAEKIITVFFKKQKPIIPDYQITKWNEEDVILITYANTFINEKKQSLKNLIIFLNRYIKKTFNSIHILPYFPYSSDDGFAVINFNEVNQSFGTWDDIKKIANKYKLMTDVVLNHCSSRSHWFEQYKNNKKPGVNFFIEADNKLNTQKIIRPRTMI